MPDIPFTLVTEWIKVALGVGYHPGCAICGEMRPTDDLVRSELVSAGPLGWVSKPDNGTFYCCPACYAVQVIWELGQVRNSQTRENVALAMAAALERDFADVLAPFLR
jgi:hypothetical protein